MPTTPLPREKRREIIRLWHTTKNRKATAAEAGVSLTTVCRVIRADHGRGPEARPEPERTAPPRISIDEQWDRYFAMEQPSRQRQLLLAEIRRRTEAGDAVSSLGVDDDDE